MERYEIGGGERMVAMVEAAARGEAAVFTRGGAALIDAMRDMDVR